MKMVITGANGFVGASLCRYFYNKGYEIIATGRQAIPNAQLLSYATYIQADITTPLEPFNADVCIHAAGLTADDATYKDLYFHNVTGTENVVHASKHCRHLIYISSSSVYKFSDKPAVESDASLDAHISNYGKTKLQAELLLNATIPEHQTRLILRPRAIYGVGDRVLLPRVLKLVKFQKILCPVDNEITTSATHVDNLAYAIELFLKQNGTSKFQVFNIADKSIYKLKDIILKTIFAVEGRSLPVVDISLWPRILPVFSKIVRSKHLTPIALMALTENSVLDLGSITKTLNYDPKQNFDNSYCKIGKWIKALGGKKDYIKSITDAPWMINE